MTQWIGGRVDKSYGPKTESDYRIKIGVEARYELVRNDKEGRSRGKHDNTPQGANE